MAPIVRIAGDARVVCWLCGVVKAGGWLVAESLKEQSPGHANQQRSAVACGLLAGQEGAGNWRQPGRQEQLAASWNTARLGPGENVNQPHLP